MSCTNGIPGGVVDSPDVAGEMAATNNYPSVKAPTDLLGRAMVIIDFALANGLPIEFGIGLAGVWAAESEIKSDVYNKSEHRDGYAFKDKHAPNADKFTYKGNTYYKDQANMMKFGYGKGLAQWSWSRNFEFRDWYNSSAAAQYRSGGPATMDENAANITATTVAAQTAFAWHEMSKRDGEFLTAVNGIQTVNASQNEAQFKANITTAVDAVLRGFENGGKNKMASTKQIDKYTWDGGYSGAMKKRVGRAVGIYEKLKEGGYYPQYLS